MENNDDKTTRRDFLQASALSLMAAGVVAGCGEKELPEPDGRQKALKRTERSKVVIAGAGSYDSALKALQNAWKEMAFSVKAKSIFLKINLVDYRENLPVYTNPALVDAAIQVLQDAGAASIKVGDGPALRRDTEEIARLSGMTSICKKHSLEFVDLNIDDLEKIENPLRFTGLDEFLIPRSISKSDLVISVPKLKTHHWALMTCSMKNIFGVIPGRKYGWPKNILHVRGIDKSVVDIVATVKPGFAIVDGIVAMEGNGPLDGEARNLNIVVIGDDLIAVDTVCGMCMQLPVHKIPYLELAGKVLGNNDLAKIDLAGSSIDSVKQKFKVPPTYEEDGTPKNLNSLAKGAQTGVT